MNIRKYTPEDSVLLSKWNKEWSLPLTPASWIPERSYIVENQDIPICLGFLYQLDKTPLFWIEGIISNKEAASDLKKEGLFLLISHMEHIAKQNKAEIIMGSTPRNSLLNVYKELGFGETPEQYFHVGKRV